MTLDLHKPVINTDGGPWADHDHACSVCRENKAILILDGWIFQPCGICQMDGWKLVKKRRWFR